MPLIRCKKCRKDQSLNRHEFSGKWWNPIFTGKCRPCWIDLTFDASGGKIDPADIEPLLPEERRLRKAAESQEWFKLSEFWIQLYLLENAARYGFGELRGPRQSGPDFVVDDGNMWPQIAVEVERRWDDWLRHRHHVDDKYQKTKYLAVLSGDKPIELLLPLLPAKIVYLTLKLFLTWHRKSEARQATQVANLSMGLPVAFTNR